MNYQIRWTQEQDAWSLGVIHSNSWKTAYKGIVPDEFLDRITAKQREEYFREAIKGESEETAIIEVDGQAVGFITLGCSRDSDLPEEYGEIWGIYLSPGYWHKGIGRILINWGLRELAARGYKKAALWVLEENKNAIGFYEKLGFGFDGGIKTIALGRKLNEIRYSKLL